MNPELTHQYKPKLILLFCGKRKTGKDFLTEQLQKLLQPTSNVIIRLSGPLKKCYAKENNLNYEELLSAGSYKEQHRLNMIKWSEEIRNKDFGYFCRAALEMYQAENYEIWIVSDCRRKTDFTFFRECFPSLCQTVRITASEETRISRGYQFQDGVDNAESECGLDDVGHFDHVIHNDGNTPAEILLQDIIQAVKTI